MSILPVETLSAPNLGVRKPPSDIKNLSIALVSVLNPEKNYALNKDLNGGFGTADRYEGFKGAGFARFIKKHAVKIPVIGFANLQGILKKKCKRINYYEERHPENKLETSDVILLHGTIIDYKYENYICRRLKQKFPDSKIGFLGEFVSTSPDLFSSGDFVIIGEAESFFLNEFTHLDQLCGFIYVKQLTDYDALPTLNLDSFLLDKYNYSFSLKKSRYITYQGSKGCPFSCSYYCTYGKIQGPKIRQRSAQKIADDFLELQSKYAIGFIQFRDPIFGLQKNFIEEFCNELRKKDIRIKWGMETRLDLLNEEQIKNMYAVGLRQLNTGIETVDPITAKKNKRLLVEKNHQEKLIRFCAQIGIKVSAFYIIGLESDTIEKIRRTIDYAVKLNTPVARFSVATPYPGTAFYDRLDKEGRILTKNFENYTQFQLVYKHEHLSPKLTNELLGLAYRKYYLRPSYIFSVLKWFLRDLTEKK